jgi:endo-1,4-beta-D-glucanase Y
MTNSLQKRWRLLPLGSALIVILGLGISWWFIRARPQEDVSILKAKDAAWEFLDGYVAPNGRVSRRDQGGDTVSEGQAYAMLLAVALRDKVLFDRVWNWTREHLQRPDGLLSWHWRNGRVLDRQSAADADLDAARALLLASERFAEPGYRRDALHIARAILAKETAWKFGRVLLVAGPWARSMPLAINPSYFSPRAFQELLAATHNRRWIELTKGAHWSLAELTDNPPRLPPDWATARAKELFATASPGDDDGHPVYGLDAARGIVRFAESCGASSRGFAASAWPFLQKESTDGVASSYSLSGERESEEQHPVSMVAAAAAAHAAGAHKASSRLLDRAENLEERFPSYYGAAWVALGRTMLASLLGDCSI